MAIKHDTPQALAILANFALANAIFSAFDLGFFDPFKSINHESVLNVKDLGRKQNWNLRILIGLAEYLSHRNVLKSMEKNNYEYTLGELGKHLIIDGWIGYLVYYVGGYGNVLLNSRHLAKNELIYGQTIQRDIDWVVVGTELMSLTKHHKSYSAVLEACKRESAERVLDIGCGTAKFLIELVKASNSNIGVGIDISAQACEMAGQVALNSRLDKQIDIVCGDFLKSSTELKAKYKDFDIITAMMIIHEYLYEGEAKVIQVLTSICELLSKTGSFILLDKATDALEHSPLYFTEFKLAHDLTNQNLCSKLKWEDILNKAGLRLRTATKLPEHTGSILLECVKK
jgi:SAM-dependent methyltransferase